MDKGINVITKKRLEGSAVTISFTNKYMVAIDNAYDVYLFYKDDFKVYKSTKLSKTHEAGHRYTKAFSVSKDEHILIPLLGTSTAVLLHFEDSFKKIKNLNWHSADVEVSKFSDNFPYFATGGADGKILIYDTPTGNLILSLKNKPDYISTISFGKDNELIAVGAFDNSVTIFDIGRNEVVSEFFLSDVIEGCEFFDRDRKLFIITRDGYSVIYDVEKNQIISKNKNFKEWPTAIAFTPDEKFVLIGTRQKNLYILTTEENEKILDVKLSGIGVANLKFYKTDLFIGYIDGTLEIVDYYMYEKEFEDHINKRSFNKARELLLENIFLRTHPLVERFNESWEHVVILAIEMIGKGQGSEAYQMVEPFLDDPNKDEEFKFYLEHKNHIITFMNSVRNKDLLVAYDLVEDNKFLEKLQGYKQLEEEWQKAFNAAKKLLQEDPELNRGKAMQILKAYTALPTKKRQINFLVNNAKKFGEADIAVKDKNFKKYFQMTESYPFLKEVDLYDKVTTFGEGLLVNLSTFEQKQEYKNALAIAAKLIYFVPFAGTVTEKIKLIKAKMKFIESVAMNNEKYAYEQVEKRPELKLMPQFEELENRFKDVLERANQEAFQGYPEKVLERFKEYMLIDYWSSKIGAVMKVAYLNEIKDNARDKSVDWKETLIEYVTRFSKDTEIQQLCKQFNKSDELDAVSIKGDEMGYKKYEYLKTIISKNKEEEKSDVDKLAEDFDVSKLV